MQVMLIAESITLRIVYSYRYSFSNDFVDFVLGKSFMEKNIKLVMPKM